MDNIYIKGGSSINPYCQLKKQRKRFYDVYNEYLKNELSDSDYFYTGHTLRVVCFQHEVDIKGKIPANEEINFKIIHEKII